MTIQKQYRSSKCNLVLDGFSSNGDSIGTDGRSILSILSNAELNFSDKEIVIRGDREFLQTLVSAVSAYTQELLSGLPHPQPPTAEQNQWVHLEAIDKGLHRLSWLSESQQQQLDLTTVELFDLLDTLDQFVADPTSLPEFQLPLRSLPRGSRKADENVAQKATPLTLGLGTLAAAAIALSWLPLPPPRSVPTDGGNPPQTTPAPPQNNQPKPPQ